MVIFEINNRVLVKISTISAVWVCIWRWKSARTNCWPEMKQQKKSTTRIRFMQIDLSTSEREIPGNQFSSSTPYHMWFCSVLINILCTKNSGGHPSWFCPGRAHNSSAQRGANKSCAFHVEDLRKRLEYLDEVDNRSRSRPMDMILLSHTLSFFGYRWQLFQLLSESPISGFKFKFYGPMKLQVYLAEHGLPTHRMAVDWHFN